MRLWGESVINKLDKVTCLNKVIPNYSQRLGDFSKVTDVAMGKIRIDTYLGPTDSRIFVLAPRTSESWVLITTSSYLDTNGGTAPGKFALGSPFPALKFCMARSPTHQLS